MKILHFCMGAPFTEGYSYQDNLLTEYQHKHGHEVMIVTSTRTRNSEGKIVETAPGQRVLDNGVILLRLPNKSKIRNLLGIYTGIQPIMKSFQPDLIFIHGLCSFLPAQAIRYKKKQNRELKIIADNHQDEGTTNVSNFPFRQIMWLHRLGWKQWIKEVEEVFGTTSWRVAFAQKYYGIPAEKIDTLIMGIDSDRLPTDRENVKRAVREAQGIESDAFVFVTGGKLDSRKRILESVRAFRMLENKNARFLIFGSVDEKIRDEFISLVETDKRIHYIGYIPSKDVQRYFIASDFGVFPGRHSVLWEEAIGCGLPCIFRRYEKKDHTEVCDNCICMKNATDQEIYKIMLRMTTDPGAYGRMKHNAEEATKVFSYHAIAERSVACIERDHYGPRE